MNSIATVTHRNLATIDLVIIGVYFLLFLHPRFLGFFAGKNVPQRLLWPAAIFEMVFHRRILVRIEQFHRALQSGCLVPRFSGVLVLVV